MQTSTIRFATFVLVAGAASAAFAAQTPIMGTGYNRDVIADGSTAANTTAPGVTPGGIDGQFAYIPIGYVPASTSGGPATLPPGLPTGTTFTSAFDSTTSFALKPAAGNNTLYLGDGAPTQTFTLSTPGKYSSLSFLATGLNAAGTFQYRVTYADGSTSALGSGTAPDNFNGTGTAIFARGRVQLTSNQLQLVDNNPRLYQVNANITIDPTRSINSIIFTGTNTGGAGTIQLVSTAIFGISGTAVSEPASLGLLGLGAAGLIGRRRRTA